MKNGIKKMACVHKIVVVLSLMIFSMVNTAGCWNHRELDSLGIVLGMGIDQAKEKDKVLLTAQVVKPAEIGSPGKGGGTGKEPYLNITNTGDTVFEAVRRFTQMANRRMYLAHNEVIILGNELAREGVRDSLDIFFRDPEPRLTTWILVAKEKAGGVLETVAELEKIPALNLAQLLDEAVATSEIPAVNLNDFCRRLMSKTTAPVASLVEVSEGEKKKIARLVGAAVFKEDKLAGYLTLTESRGLLWVLNEIKSGIIVVKNPKGKGEVSLEILRAKSKVKVEMKDGTPLFTVEVKEEGNLGEQICTDNLVTQSAWATLEQNQAGVIRQEIKAALQKAQDLNTDIFGFGEAIYRKHPALWKELEPRWDEIFPRLEVYIVVETELRRSGMITRPVTPAATS
jgi:spore germination protein KC